MTLVVVDTVQDEAFDVDFVTSDTHFGHVNISKLANRPFDNTDSTEAMDEAMVSAWNSVVSPDDVVLHMGDIVMGQRGETLPILSRLNGCILLCPGNHDDVSSLTTVARRERMTPVYSQYTTILSETGLLLETESGGVADASHYPFRGSEDHRERRFDKLQVEDTGTNLLVHGHTHSPNVLNGRQFHVGVDAHNFTPVSADVLSQWIDANQR